MARHRIELARVGDDVAITFLSTSDRSSHTARITTRDAFNLGLLMDSARPDYAVNLVTRNGVALQIENHPYDRAWLTMEMAGGNLIVCIEGDTINDIGRDFWKLARAENNPAGTSLNQTALTHLATDFYRDAETGDQGLSPSS